MVEDPTKRTKKSLDSQANKSKLGDFASIKASQAIDQTEPSKLLTRYIVQLIQLVTIKIYFLGIWKEMFGVETSELKKLVRILSLYSSASNYVEQF